MIDYKSLKGDTTDNIPGVPGVGEKTAAKLIREFGDLDAVYARLDEVKPDKLREKLAEHREQVFLGRELSTIIRDLPVSLDLEAARLGDYDRDEVIRLFREYEFRSLLDRLPPLSGESATDDRGRDPRRQPDRARGPRRDGPAGRVGERPPDPGHVPRRRRRRPSGGLQLSLDFGAVGAEPGAPPAGVRVCRRAPPDHVRGPADRARRRDRRSRATSSSTRATGSTRSRRGSPRSPRSASRSSSTTRGRGWVRRSRSPWRVVTAASSSPADRPTVTGSGISPRRAASRSSATR